MEGVIIGKEKGMQRRGVCELKYACHRFSVDAMVYLTNNTDLAFEVPYIQAVLCKVLNHT